MSSKQSVSDDTKTLGIVALILAFVMPLVGLIISIIGKSQAKKVEAATRRPAEGAGLLTAALVISICIMALVPMIFIVALGSVLSLGMY